MESLIIQNYNFQFLRSSVGARLHGCTDSIDKPLVEVQVQVDDWVFIKIAISNQPPSQPPPGKFQRSKLELDIQNKSC